jgi:hypothetical protein
MSLRKARKHLPRAMRYAADHGWTYDVNPGGKHARLVKQGRTVVVPRSPSDHRSDLNCRSFLKRYDQLMIEEQP